jgi:hypothetical protein
MIRLRETVNEKKGAFLNMHRRDALAVGPQIRIEPLATNANAYQWKMKTRISSSSQLAQMKIIKTIRADHITEHSPSCLCAGTPISSKVFGPLPGFAAGGLATAPAGFGVVEGEGSAGPSVNVTGFLPGTSAGPGGGREAGREEGAEVRP